MHDRIEAAAARADATKSEWVLAALEFQLEIEEGLRPAPEIPHMPEAVKQALPQYNPEQAQVTLPAGRIPGVR